MRNLKKVKSETDWERVRREAAADAPIPFNAEDELYNPNDESAAENFLENALVRRGRGPQKNAVKRAIKEA